MARKSSILKKNNRKHKEYEALTFSQINCFVNQQTPRWTARVSFITQTRSYKHSSVSVNGEDVVETGLHLPDGTNIKIIGHRHPAIGISNNVCVEDDAIVSGADSPSATPNTDTYIRVLVTGNFVQLVFAVPASCRSVDVTKNLDFAVVSINQQNWLWIKRVGRDALEFGVVGGEWFPTAGNFDAFKKIYWKLSLLIISKTIITKHIMKLF